MSRHATSNSSLEADQDFYQLRTRSQQDITCAARLGIASKLVEHREPVGAGDDRGLGSAQELNRCYACAQLLTGDRERRQFQASSKEPTAEAAAELSS